MLKAFITSLVLVTSTAAMADTPYDHPYPSQYDRYDHGRYDHAVRGRVLLQQDIALTDRPVFIQLDRRDGLRRIRIERRQGRTLMNRIDAVFADGRRQALVYNARISPKEPVVIVDLPRGTTGLIIDSSPTRQGRGGGWRSRWNGTREARVDIVGVHVRRR